MTHRPPQRHGYIKHTCAHLKLREETQIVLHPCFTGRQLGNSSTLQQRWNGSGWNSRSASVSVHVCRFFTQFRDFTEKSNYKWAFLMKTADKKDQLVVNYAPAENKLSPVGPSLGVNTPHRQIHLETTPVVFSININFHSSNSALISMWSATIVAA